jgi:hypothetical protein
LQHAIRPKRGEKHQHECLVCNDNGHDT